MRGKIPLKIRKAIPKFAYRLFFLLKDNLDLLIRKRDRLTPPDHLNLVGGSVFTEDKFDSVGSEYFFYLKTLVGIKPSDYILDVGCGIERIAIPLTKFLTSGRYYGFDINKEVIKWDQKNITSYYPNFHFIHANIYNQFYNPGGIIKPDEFKFPYKSDSFDIIFLISIFTHLREKEMEHYFKEIQRVLKVNGKVFITFFLINEESKELIKKGLQYYNFRPINERLWSHGSKIIEHGIAYKETYILELFKSNKLKILDIFYGNWVSRKEFLGFQDMIIARKDRSYFEKFF